MALLTEKILEVSLEIENKNFILHSLFIQFAEYQTSTSIIFKINNSSDRWTLVRSTLLLVSIYEVAMLLTIVSSNNLQRLLHC